ncbi:MAG: hypothetical protein JXB45_13010 [Candidatus Krumholzibacteriota bacterium]|nr:hypothetical protein [Candidatus Krumholzibacteriota bacterium]
MKRNIGKGFFCGFFILCLWMVPVSARSGLGKVTIVVSEARVHMGPDSTSRVIARPSLNSIYEIVGKAGEWYEIKLPSRLGMIITGFIHEKYVKVEKPVGSPRPDTLQVPQKKVPPWFRREKSRQVKLGGLWHHQMDYDYKYPWFVYYQNGAIYDSIDQASVYGFQLGGGWFVFGNIEIDLGFHYATATLDGVYGVDLPNRQLANDIVHAEATAHPRISEMIFILGLNYHVLREGRLRPYCGGGISYIKGEIELLDEITYAETFLPGGSHEVEITDIKLISTNLNILGFSGKVGLDMAISESIIIFGEGQYLVANKKVPHPKATKLKGEDALLEIDRGGITVLLGVKIPF